MPIVNHNRRLASALCPAPQAIIDTILERLGEAIDAAMAE
jgi:hypothetical protein